MGLGGKFHKLLFLVILSARMAAGRTTNGPVQRVLHVRHAYSSTGGMTQLNFSCDFYRMPAPSALETRIGCTRHGLEEGADFSSADHFGNMSWVDLPARLPDSVNRKFEPETCHGPYNRSF